MDNLELNEFSAMDSIFQFLLTSLIILFAFVKSEFPTQIFIKYSCEGNSSNNTLYKSNLNTLLSSISSKIDASGFYNATVGENSNRVNVIALCRADLQLYQCRDYIKNATAEILKRCPDQEQAILWHEFCMVRFSNERMYGTLAYSPFRWGHSRTQKVPNKEKFYPALNILLDSLRNYTAYNRSLTKFGAASRAYPDDDGVIYAFEQCTPDISPKECDDCLTKSSLYIRQCCDEAAGVRILRPSCYLRFESYPFYNETMVETLIQLSVPSDPIPLPPTTPRGKDDKATRTIIIATVIVAVFLGIVLSVGIFLKRKNTSKPPETIETDNETSSIESLQYDFGTIRTATNNFSDSNELGHGGFGVVYKGNLPNKREVAVKRLSRNSEHGGLEFKNEVLLLAKLQHRNLVRLLGFSVEGSERLLIYEWVQNGSLDHFIFDSDKNQALSWEKRYGIIGGIARGLLYLHQDSRFRIVHRDLKASNILLDKDMNPKISDFGMARLFAQNESKQHSTSRIVGTYGYMAPEYVMHGQFSVKSDVYSYGILVLEIISGQKINSFQKPDVVDDLISYVWRNWHKGTATNVIDQELRASSSSLRDILRCVHIGLLCVQENATDRPTMESVVLMLSSFSITLPLPSQPAFFMSSTSDPKISAPGNEGPSKVQLDNIADSTKNDT